MGKSEKNGIDNPALESHGDPVKISNDNSMTSKNGIDNLALENHGDPVNISNDNSITSHICKKSLERDQWGNSLEFLMSCITMSVGLGNIWRFPFTAYENGGGAFIIPYFIVLTFIGRPLYYLEMALGQFRKLGTVKTYESLAVGMKGVGYGQLIGVICVATYSCPLNAISLLYLVNSFTSVLPWTYCRDEWDIYLKENNLTCLAADRNLNLTFMEGSKFLSSSELYFTREVMKENPNLSQGIGWPDWKLTLCLLLCWGVIFLISRKGVKSSGKWSYFLALFPYVILLILLIRAVTLEGSVHGMYYFIKTDWNKLLTANVWYAAVTQCFFSLNVGFGPILMYSSFNRFDHNINRDALVVTTLDTFTSALSGIIMFGILGNLAHELGVEPDKVINSGGTGLAFISYPDALAKFQAVPWLFAILFFFMLFVLGIGCVVALQSAVNTAILDSFPSIPPWKVSLGTAIVGFFMGLQYVTPGGLLMLNLVDHFGGTFVIFVFTIIEIVGVTWWYGTQRVCIDIEFMLKNKVGVYWRISWGLITPVMLIVIFVYFIAKQERLKYGPYDYPDGILAIGWCILSFPIVLYIFWIAQHMWRNRKNGFLKAFKNIFSTKNWQPGNSDLFQEWKDFREHKLLKFKARATNWFKRICLVLFTR